MEAYGYCNLNMYLKRRTGNVGIGTHLAQRTLHVEGDIFLKGMIYDASNEPYALGAGGGSGGGGTANLEWREAVDAPQFLAPPGVELSDVRAPSYLQRFSGNENVFAIDISTVVTSNAYLTTSASNAILDYKLQVPQEYDTRVYSAGARLGDLWLRASSNGYGNTFKAFAKVLESESNVLALRYITGTADRPLTDVGVGWKIDLQGTLLYTTREFFTGLSLENVIPASMVQDTVGNIVINGGGFAPRGVLDVISTSNIPGLVVDLQRLSESNTNILEVKRNKLTKFAVSETGDMVIDGVIANSAGNALWLPGNASEWRDANAAPTWVLPAGAAFTYTSNTGKYKHFGYEVHNRFDVSGTLTSAASVAAADFALTLPYELASNLYPTETILGDVWINVRVNGYLTTYQGYAKTRPGVTSNVIVRYLNTIYDRSLGEFAAGSEITVRGEIAYQANMLGLFAVGTYKPAILRQDMAGRIMVTNTEAFPAGRFHIYENSSEPALVLQQDGSGHMIQFRSNTSIPFVVDRGGNIGVGTLTPAKGLDVAGDMRISGAIYNDRNEAIWVPGSTLEWKAAATPSFILPAGCAFSSTSASASYRYVGDEILYTVYLQGTITANSGASGQDYALLLEYPVKTAAYANPTIVGDMWLNVSSNVTGTTYKAYARTYAESASNLRVGLRYVNVAYDLPLTGIAVGSVVQLQGTIAYQTPLIANNMPVPVVYKYADFVQDQGGNVIFSGDGNAPQARFEVGQSSNAPAFIVNQRGTADILQLKKTNNRVVVVDAQGNVGVGTTVPRQKLDVQAGNAIVIGNVGVGTTVPTAPLHVVGNILSTGTIIASNVSVIGDFVTLNTVTSNTEQMVITNAGTGPGLKVTQTGAEAIAEFYDDGGVLALKVADGGNVGIGTAVPTAALSVSGNALIQSTYRTYLGKNSLSSSDAILDPSVVQNSVIVFLNSNTNPPGNDQNIVWTSTNMRRAVKLNAYGIDSYGFSGGFYFNSGNVGVGTTAPRQMLDVQGGNAIVSGNLGIGTTIPKVALQIQGNTWVSGYVSAGNIGMFRNVLINGDMRINQRGTSTILTSMTAVATVSPGSWVVDRWNLYRSGFAAGASMGQGTGMGTSDLPFQDSGIQTFARIQRVSGNTSTGFISLNNNIESQDSRRFAGKTITLSFYYRTGANFSGTSLGGGVFSGTGANEALRNVVSGLATVCYISCNSSSSWVRVNVSGTCVDITQLFVGFDYTPTGTAGANDYFDITGVQLELGNMMTPFEVRPYVTELQLCQRYYWQQATLYLMMNRTGGYKGVFGPRPVTMRLKPVESYTASEGVLYSNASTADAVQILLKSCTDAGHTVLSSYVADAEL